MDPFRLCIAVLPLAGYCIFLGAINLSRRPWLLSGARDLTILAAGISGLVIVGPMELFIPEDAAAHFGAYVWILLLAFYGLVVSFLGLISKPRLVIYNINAEHLRAVLSDVVLELDGEARWAGESLSLPTLGVQLHMESFSPLDNISLVANGEEQDFTGWRRLQRALAEQLREQTVRPHPRGLAMIIGATLAVVSSLVYSLGNTELLAQSFRQMLRL